MSWNLGEWQKCDRDRPVAATEARGKRQPFAPARKNVTLPDTGSAPAPSVNA
ncbi:hypothetical protein CONLIGDRAFT_636579 [Coniochaeta ligniaria NRRL 30616]|uniref:Uncharacterized protein n=1 Tax=Coniochaeta ligniaria NRRL 30616 TaxID=1408157 RepID=A0A1J7JA06_9PEZI|nr:hypothetical protein CONLIGDRAFT_636579 [Coniochaeta ligniaria NRRL 30616]